MSVTAGVHFLLEGPVAFRGIAWLDERKRANVSLGAAFELAVVLGNRTVLLHLSTGESDGGPACEMFPVFLIIEMSAIGGDLYSISLLSGYRFWA